MNQDRKSTLTKVVVIVVASVAILLIFRTYFYDEEAVPDMSPPSTEWTTAPEGGVEVNLPETPMRNVPIEGTDDETDAESEREDEVE